MANLPDQLLKHGAPVLKGILENVVGGIAGRVGGAIVGELAESLGVPPTKEAVSDAIEADPVRANEIIRTVEEDVKKDLSRIAEAMRDATVSYHKVLTADAAAEGWLQSRWRPMFAVIFSICFLMITVTMCRSVWIGDVPALTALAALTGFLIFLFSTGAGVLGVYVWKRSDEKQAGA